ncbi:shikimate kinase [Acidovorax sp. GBBC 3334]|uniref:shikimate kinase n=1 Tax=unclassified Acidovorax TaxID=2684926 RepID=UPI002302296D|nr:MULTISPECIES: shikimate kinase [unclassified Acidovorax]MDA8454390.1 shikimate kinase [Acidovorax sp. GBBC 3334]MDA8519500.1 shikimate kinase [Acidovorax sp. NCPPB 4044]
MRGPQLSIHLIGLPGSGKSTVGRQLARRLGLPFIDSDHVIEQRIGGSIRGFFDREGESAFRDLEEEIIRELTEAKEARVLATGGGAVIRPANRARLRERGTVVYLNASPEEIFRHIRHDQTRPLLQVASPLDRLRELQRERDPLYRETAHFVVSPGRGKNVAALVQHIAMQIELAGPPPLAP